MDLEILFELLQTFIALIAVIGLAYLVLRFGKRLTEGNANFIKILEKTTLSNHSYIAVAKIGSNYHLISVTSGDIKILKDISSEEVEASLEAKKKQFEESPISNKLTEVKKYLKEGPINKLMHVRKKS